MRSIIVLLATVGFVTTASAKSGMDSLKGSGTYGTAGCGLGSLVFGNQEGFTQVIAAFLNATGVQTFGITTGTSNCGPGLFAKAEINNYIQSNSVALENDIVRGQGETLSTLNHLLGCDAAFSGTLQKNYKDIYAPSADAARVSEKIIALSQSCHG